jgi:hypothetical protein
MSCLFEDMYISRDFMMFTKSVYIRISEKDKLSTNQKYTCEHHQTVTVNGYYTKFEL